MAISSKLKLILILSALGGWLLAFASPAWANPCTITATDVGGGRFDFSGNCPSGYQSYSYLSVDGTRIAQGSGATITASGGPYANGSHTVSLACHSTRGTSDECSTTFTVAGGPPPPPPPGPSTCTGNDIPTGLGCIPTDPTGLVNKILQIAIGVSSGIALLLLISGAFKVLTSSGDPKSVMEGKDTITSAIAGLLLILLSVAILNIIGIKILNIPIWGG